MKIWVTWLLFFVAFTYNILDVYQTNLLLNLGAAEINPIMNFVLIKSGTVNSFYIVKITIFIMLGVLLCFHQKQFKKRGVVIELKTGKNTINGKSKSRVRRIKNKRNE